ncbi:MAG TPA: alcohol dehydrogenase catalytic domain-containing protein [Bryobacteraceae bacterium]|jgi:L-iditol 2-dehydrogenase
MRVAELTGRRRIDVVERPFADVVPAGKVRVKVAAVGVCGSDLHYFSEGSIGDTPCVYPMVLGHEPSGVVVESTVGGVAKGDPVILEPALYCYHCEYCISGHHNVCANLKFLSTPEEPGFFRDYVDLPLHNVLPLPSNLGLIEGALAEPLSIILHSMEFAKPCVGETAVVFGCGPIGLLTIAVLKLAGVRRIWAVEPLTFRREMARSMGADAVLNSGPDAVKQILSDSGGRGADLVIDCAAKDGSINQSLQVCRPCGRVVMTGIPSEATVEFAFHIMRRKELFFYAVRRSNHDSKAALEMLAERPQFFAPIVTHRRPFDGIQSAFAMNERYEDGVGKLVLEL